jgi:hypothetical protein
MPRKTSKWTTAYQAGYHAGYKSELRRMQGKTIRKSVVKQVKSTDYKHGERDGRKAAREGRRR